MGDEGERMYRKATSLLLEDMFLTEATCSKAQASYLSPVVKCDALIKQCCYDLTCEHYKSFFHHKWQTINNMKKPKVNKN